MFLKPGGEKHWLRWDVHKNGPTDQYAQIATSDKIVAFLPGNKQVIVKQGLSKYLYNARDGKSLSKLPQLPAEGLVAETGALVVLRGYVDGTVRLFDALSGKERAAFPLPGGEGLVSYGPLALSPDGRYACAKTNGSVYLLRLPTTKDRP